MMNKYFIAVLITALVFITAPCNAAGDSNSGKEVAKQCVACHGEDGNSPAPNFPRLAGQHEDYLLHALQSYKQGKRKNVIMAGIVAALSEEDMKNVSAYFSQQQGLATIELENESSQ